MAAMVRFKLLVLMQCGLKEAVFLSGVLIALVISAVLRR
jgi:hypothetical protein